MATIYDIANLCRTSIATVSYVLNGRGDEHRISKATQEKVLSVAESLNYRPNTSAKRLSSDSAHQLSIALFWPNYYFEQALISALRAVNEVTKLFSEPAEINLQFYEPGHAGRKAEYTLFAALQRHNYSRRIQRRPAVFGPAPRPRPHGAAQPPCGRIPICDDRPRRRRTARVRYCRKLLARVRSYNLGTPVPRRNKHQARRLPQALG